MDERSGCSKARKPAVDVKATSYARVMDEIEGVFKGERNVISS